MMFVSTCLPLTFTCEPQNSNIYLYKSRKIPNHSLISDFWTLFQLAQPARLLLEYTGSKYENKFYVCGEGNISMQLTVIILKCPCYIPTKSSPLTLTAPNYDKSCWFDEKPKLGMDFPNVSLTCDY